MGKRAENRQATEERLLAAAWRQVAEHGGGALSVRAVAREVGMVSSAVFRYFPSRGALLTTMIKDSYQRLGAELASVDEVGGAERWTRLARCLRTWAREHPHEFQLIYGTPIPGYVAPSETIALAADVAAPFLAVASVGPVAGFATDLIAAGSLPGDPSGAAAVLAELAALVGFVSLELAGHFVGTADPADALFDALVARQAVTLGLTGQGRGHGR